MSLGKCQNEEMYLQYGCGFDTPRQWVNFDSAPILFIRENWFLKLFFITILRRKDPFPKNVLYGNILKGFPKYNNRCKGLYCSHVLEHLTLAECRLALKNSYDLLAKGGTFRLVLPSLESFVREYVSRIDLEDGNAAVDFCKNTYLGREKHENMFRECLKIFFFKNYHFMMWDFYSLKKELQDVGFTNIKEVNFGDSKDDMFKLVENIERFESAVAIECMKE